MSRLRLGQLYFNTAITSKVWSSAPVSEYRGNNQMGYSVCYKRFTPKEERRESSLELTDQPDHPSRRLPEFSGLPWDQRRLTVV